MELGDLLRETLSVDCDEVWENERTPSIQNDLRNVWILTKRGFSKT